MSVRVLNKVFQYSEATLGSRIVLFVLADAAWDDGITWISQQDLSAKARLSDSQTRDCLRRLEESGAIEVRKAQRGRRRINVYRIILPGLLEPDYERMPFTIKEEFSRPLESGGCQDGGDRRILPMTAAGFLMSPARASELGVKPLNLNHKKTVRGTANAVPAERPRNLVYDALAAACSIRPQLLDANQPIYDKDLARMIGAAQGSIRNKAKGLDDETLAAEVHLRAEAYRRKWPDIDLTPTALAKHWNTVVMPRGRGGLTPDEIERMEAT